MTAANGSALDGGQIEPTEPVGICQNVQLNDLAARYRDSQDYARCHRIVL